MRDIMFLVRKVRSLPGPLPMGAVALQRANELAGPIALTSEEESAFLEAWSGNSDPLLTPYAKRTVSCLTEASEILGNMATACADGAQHVRDFGASEENARDAAEIQGRTRALSDFVDGDAPYTDWLATLAPIPSPFGPIPQKREGSRLVTPVQKLVDMHGPGMGAKEPHITFRGEILGEITHPTKRALLVYYVDRKSQIGVTILLVYVGMGDCDDEVWVEAGEEPTPANYITLSRV